MERLGEQRLHLSDLARFPGNARIHADDQIRASVKRLGQYRPLVVRVLDDDSMVILAGNGTADAMEAEGFTEGDCALLKCSDDEAARINIADNRISDLATDDKDALVELLSYLDGDYEGTGFTAVEVDRMIDPPLPDELGDGEEAGMRWGVIVECGSEDEQLRLLETLSTQGLSVRALMT
jgi:ParB-like chromosome segregation protein Spo0J